jgi:hypothetical protein
MSFSPEIRSTGNFQDSFSKLRRRIQKSEIQRDDLEQLQAHVNDIRTQLDFTNVTHITDNLASNPIGPHNFIFEPDLTEVMIYQPFTKVFGDGIKLSKTLNGSNYDVIEIGDSTYIVSPYTYSNGVYHYEPYQSFDGTNYVSQADAAALDLNNFTISCWFRTSNEYTDGTEGMLVNKGGLGSESAGDNLNYGVWMEEGIVQGGFETSGGTDKFATSSLTYNDFQWHHALCYYDSTRVALRVDNIEVGDNVTTSTPETNAKDLVIGKNSRDDNRYFIGDIDEVNVWNRALTSSEKDGIFNTNTIPGSGLVYSNSFGGSGGITSGTKKCYYAVPSGTASWDWNIGFHPPSIKSGNSIPLNLASSSSNQFIYYDMFGTDLDFTAQNFSIGFWIYPTDLSDTGKHRFVAGRNIDANNYSLMEIDNTDNKLFSEIKVGGVSTKRQYDTALAINNWYYINQTWQTTPTLSLKVNNNADTTTTKSADAGPVPNGLHFGSYGDSPNQGDVSDFQGYLAFPIYYKHSTVLTTAERTSLYNYNTRSNTTVPLIWGYARFG